jgi:hypothetical protein
VTAKVTLFFGTTHPKRYRPDFCVEPRSAQEILENFGLYNQSRTRKRYIADLVEKGLLVMTIPNNPTDRNQKYQRKQLTENQDPQI